MIQNFNHIQTAHCENGVTLGLLKHYGVERLSEPLIFGIGSGLFYIHVPYIILANGPAISFRIAPGAIFKRTSKNLGIKITNVKFKTLQQGQEFLDKQLDKALIVGCRVGAYDLVYFPVEYRFHFNAHNIIIFKKDDTHYHISDPVVEYTTLLTPPELEKVRFVKGLFAPQGHLYFPKYIPPISDKLFKQAIIKGIKRNTRDMLHIPAPITGVKGIVYTSKKIRKILNKLGEHKSRLYLAQIIRMQEEIGTGGGGFRFIYAAFLEQVSEIFNNNEEFLTISNEFTKAGDLWRKSAFQMAGIFKKRLFKQEDYNEIADIMLEISNVEKQAFKKLEKMKLNKLII